MTPQSLRNYPSWAIFSLLQSSLTKPVCSESEESLPQVPTPHAQPSQRSSSRTSSSRPKQTPKSSPKGKCQAQKVDPMNDMSISGSASVVSSTGCAKPQTAWSTGDSYLPRAKPPPPLKRIKHRRNCSENNSPPPVPTTSSQPSTFHHRSSRQSSESLLTALQPGLDTPILDIASERSNTPVVQHMLTRWSTRMSTASEVSNITDISFAPSEVGSSRTWEPPTSWAGPSGAVSADEGDGSKPVARCSFTSNFKKSAESSTQDGSAQVPTRARALRKLRPIHLANVGEPEEEASDIREGPLPSGVIKIHCYEGKGWHEKPITDVIQKLRELKVK